MADLDPRSTDVAGTVMATFGRLTRPISYRGLPVGFQLVPPFAEATLLNAGHLYQRETDWHTMEPPLEASPDQPRSEARQ